MNNDLIPDVITVNLGRAGIEQGSLSVLLVRLVKAADTNGTNIAAGWVTNLFTFNTNLVLAGGGHVLLICSDKLGKMPRSV